MPLAQVCLAPSVAIRILSADVSYESDVGGVKLGLRSAQEALAAAERMHDMRTNSVLRHICGRLHRAANRSCAQKRTSL